MSTGYQRFASSPTVAKLKETAFERASRQWLALPDGFRRFVARHAGLPAESGDKPLQDLPAQDRKALQVAAARLVDLALSAREPLLSAVLSDPPLPHRKAA